MDTSNDEPIDIGAQASGGEPVPWDQVPVVVSFEVGALELSLAELKSLAPGVVLRIGDHRGANVALRCAGRTVGLGELVELDDSLAVEVTQIGLRH